MPDDKDRTKPAVNTGPESDAHKPAEYRYCCHANVHCGKHCWLKLLVVAAAIAIIIGLFHHYGHDSNRVAKNGDNQVSIVD